MTNSSALAAASPQTPQSEALDKSQNAEQWHALGYYAVSELSVGHSHNALYAYRLLCTLDPFETRWKLGRAFCALNMKRVAEAQKILEPFSLKTPSKNTAPIVSVRQQTLLHRCQERLAYLQQQKAKTLIAQQPQSNKHADSGKLLSFPNAPR